MSGDHARRTSSGRTLRLVGGTAAHGADQSGADQSGADQSGADGVRDPDAESLVLPGQRQSVAVGRHWVVSTAASRGITGMANQVLELLSSELLANAVLHGTEGGAVGLQMRQVEGFVRVSVSDASPQNPVVMHNGPAALNGRGMAIVEAMSTRWGVEEHDEGGKTVWYELDLADF